MRYRIIWMIDSLMPGGAEQLLPTILMNFDQERFDIHVLVLQVRRGNPIAEELEKSGIEVDLAPNQIRNLRNPMKILRVFQYLKNHSPVLIHTQLEHSDMLGNIFAKILGIPSVSTLHTLEFPKKKRLAFWRLRFKWFVLKYFCDQVITVSNKTQEHHLQYGRLPQKKLSTIYNGIQVSRFQDQDPLKLISKRKELNISSDQKVISTIAVLREPKGIQYMIEALPNILEQQPDIKYMIVGDGVYATSLQDLVTALRLQDHVVFTGRRTDIPDMLAISDLFVLPSLGDALPTVLIEALSAGTPIITTNVGGIPEIIENNINGLLVPPADSQSLADACLKLLKDQELSHRLSTKGLETAELRFDVKVQVEQLEGLYTKLIKQYEN